MNEAPRSAADDAARQAEMMSSMADGELDPAQVQQGCRLWREDGEARAKWHAYHLIGDVMRSDELTAAPGRDAAFLSGLRARLAGEPPVVAPTRWFDGARERGMRWAASAAMVAGVAAVVGVVMLTREPAAVGPDAAGQSLLASDEARTPGMQRVSAGSAPPSAQGSGVDGRLVRDARLDAYFDAHRGAVGDMPSAMPGGVLRNVEMVVPAPR